MLRDISNNLYCECAFPPKAAVTDNTAFVSTIFDTANFGSVMLSGTHGTNADANATYTVLVEDGDNSALTDNAAVADAFLIGVEAMGLDFADDDKAFKIGYIGPKRYVRVTITPAGNTGNAFIAGNWIASGARDQPQSTQVEA